MRRNKEGAAVYSDYEPRPDWQGGPISHMDVAPNTRVMVYPAGPNGRPFEAVVCKLSGSSEDRSYVVTTQHGQSSLGSGTAVEVIARNYKV